MCRIDLRLFTAVIQPSHSPTGSTGNRARCLNGGKGAAPLSFRIVEHQTFDLLGGINLTNVRRGIVQAGTLGYWIGASFARQGYMTEGMTAVLSFAFETLNLNRVEAACLPDNAASRALLEKCGFREEGRARKYLRINGMWQDHVLYGILREDWIPKGVRVSRE